MTFKEFKDIPYLEVFLTGCMIDGPDGINMTGSGKQLRWVAKKGEIDDWTVYCQLENQSIGYITNNGDKVFDPIHIRRCVPCDNEMLKHYRY